ncbi:rhomboid family protein [Treponema pallidum subsp. pallidum]|nr:rhomboid family protein [Treponema pallidum subsp. pallidum]
MIRKPFRYSYTNVTLSLVLANGAVFVITSLVESLGIYLALVPGLVRYHRMYWQIFTYQFVHSGVWHLLFNMLGLVFFGQTIEKKMGSSEMLLFYLLVGTLCGAGACAAYLCVGRLNVLLLGASGSIFAILFLFSVMFPTALIYLWGVIPIPAPLLIVGYILFEIFDLFFSRDNVSHLTHLLGVLFAWGYIRIRFGIKPLKVWSIVP